MMKGGGEIKTINVKYSDGDPITAELESVDSMDNIGIGDIFEIKQKKYSLYNQASNINGANIQKFNAIKQELIDAKNKSQNIIEGANNIKNIFQKYNIIENHTAEIKRIDTKISYMKKYYFYYSYKILGIKKDDTTYIPLYNYTPSDVKNYSIYNHYATSYYVNTCGKDENDETDLGIEKLGNFSDINIELSKISIRKYTPTINVINATFDCKLTE